MKKILKCQKCGNYTLKDTCTKCKEKTTLIKPPKYSPTDKYAEYRIKARKEQK